MGHRWNCQKSYDLEVKTVGIYGAGAIGQLVAMCLRAFEVKMYYYKRSRLSNVEEEVCGFRYTRLDDMRTTATSSSSEHPSCPKPRASSILRALWHEEGRRLVNTSHGVVVDRNALVEALEEGYLAGYAGDVWDPAPSDHP